MNLDATKATRWMTRELKDARAYASRQAELGNPEAAVKVLADYAAGEQSIGAATGALDDLANIQSTLGCVAVLDNNDHGFAGIDLACLYKYWTILCLIRNFDRNDRPNKRGVVLMDGVARCWMHAEAIGAKQLRGRLDKVIASVVDGYPGVIGRDMNALCTLAAHYATGRDVKDLEASGWAPIEVYGPVVAGKFTAGDYDGLATYHQKGVDGSGFPPFHSYPYRVIAFELLAISRRTGIPIEGQHPLLTTSLARLRDVPEIPMTDELRGVVERATKELSIDP